MLPGFDGFELCRKLRAAGVWTPRRCSPPATRWTTGSAAWTQAPTTTWSSRSACSELGARLRALARGTTGPAGRPGEGDLKLDPASKRAWRGGTELQLSPKEFSLLELFLRHPGTVLTRSQILEAAWDFAYDGTSNVVDQYVTYLRRKIDAPFGRHDLETVRGMGYRLRHVEQE